MDKSACREISSNSPGSMESSDRRLTYLMLAAMLVWGLSWPLGKLIAGVTPHRVIVFWRFLITLVAFIPLVRILRVPFRLDFSTLLKIFAGSFFYSGYSELFFLGLETGLPGAGGVLVTTLNPVITASLVSLIEWKRPGLRTIGGILHGLVGSFFLINIREMSFDSLLRSGNLYFLLAAASWSVLTLITRSASDRISSPGFTFYVYLFSAAVEGILVSGDAPEIAFRAGIFYWSVILYLGLVSTAFGTTVYFFASSGLGPVRAGSFLFLVPVTALLGSWLISGEAMSWNVVIGGIFSIRAVYLINTPEGSRRSFFRRFPGKNFTEKRGSETRI